MSTAKMPARPGSLCRTGI